MNREISKEVVHAFGLAQLGTHHADNPLNLGVCEAVHNPALVLRPVRFPFPRKRAGCIRQDSFAVRPLANR